MHALKFHFLFLWSSQKKKKSLEKENGEFPWKWHFLPNCILEKHVYTFSGGYIVISWLQMTAVPNKKKQRTTQKCTLQIRGVNWVEMEKKKKRYKIMHQDRKLCKKKKKTKNTFIFTTVITGYIISVFLWVGSWGHIEKENKGGKKRIQKQTGFEKTRRDTTQSKKKKKSYKKLNLLHLISKSWK